MKKLFFILTIVGMITMVTSLLGMVLLYDTLFYILSFNVVSVFTIIFLLTYDRLVKKETNNI